ncbi:MAG: Ig-like domain-containing protein [Lysinibacillus sp.]
MKKNAAMMTIVASLLFTALFTSTATAKTWAGFSNTSIDKEWTVKFNREIAPHSINGNVYMMKGSAKIEVAASVKGNVLTVNPAKNLDYHSSYTLVVTPKIKDIKGKTMGGAVIIPFTTASAPFPEPYKTFETEYDMTWNMMSDSYEDFHLIGRMNGMDAGGYETRIGKSAFGITVGANRSAVENKYGEPVPYLSKGKVNYTQNYKDGNGNRTSGTYVIDGHYVTFFYDGLKGNAVRSITWVTKDMEASKPGFFRKSTTDAYRDSLEETMVHLINQTRVAEGLHPLIYTPQHNDIGRAHSADMAMNNYFSHADKNGGTALSRMQAGGLKKFTWYGENLAYGQYSAIYAHEALMNSKGHRDNILRPNFTHVLVGVAFNSKGAPYFTINFYRQ